MQLSHTSNTTSKRTRVAAALIAIACALSLSLLAGCSQAQQQAPEEKPVTATDYMTAMAKSSTQLSESLAAFSQTVADNDISALQAKADAAYEVLGQMEALEAPDELKSVKGKYDEAIGSLKDSLKDYLALYLEIENAPDGAPYDFSQYAQRIEAIQKSYDQGLNLLEEADKMATEM